MHRARLEKRKRWVGPRKFDDWLRGLAERELGKADEAEAAPMPQVTLLAAYL